MRATLFETKLELSMFAELYKNISHGLSREVAETAALHNFFFLQFLWVLYFFEGKSASGKKVSKTKQNPK